MMDQPCTSLVLASLFNPFPKTIGHSQNGHGPEPGKDPCVDFPRLHDKLTCSSFQNRLQTSEQRVAPADILRS